MSALNPQIIKDALGLITLYQNNPVFRERFNIEVKRNINVPYQARPVKFYFEVLASINAPKYRKPYQVIRRLTLRDEEGITGKTLMAVTPKDFLAFNLATVKTQQLINTTSYPDAEIDQINQIEQSSITPAAKQTAHQNRLDHTRYLVADEVETIKTEGQVQPKSWSIRVGQVKQAISHPREVIRSFFRRGAVKTVSTGVGTRFATGRVAAVSAGKIAAKYGINATVKAGAGLLAKLGISALTGVATVGVGFVVGVIITLATTFSGQTKKLFKYVLYIVLALFLIFFVSSSNQKGIKVNSFLPPYQLPSDVSITPTPTTPVPTITVTPGNLASCHFYRAGISAQFNSSLLLSYFQEASQLSGVPAVLLAAITRVEPLGIVGYTDAGLPSFPCLESGTGALGLMQLQPAGTIGYCSECINLGANYLGKTADTLTRADYCDLRKNIIIAAGFILKKTHYMTGEPGNNWNSLWMTDKSYIDKVAAGYYGCLLYGGAADCTGPNNYGTDLWTSIINCQPSISPPVTPSPGSTAFNSYFCQSNPAWASSPISSSGETMSSGGCGLTSIAMVLNYFGLSYTPAEILAKFNQNPSWYTSAGTNISATLGWVESLGFEVVELNPDVSALERDIPRYLNNGYLILGSQYIASPLSHIFVVSDSLPNGNVILEDPDKSCQPNLEKTITGIMEGYSHPTYGRWMYAKAIKKVR